jgi:hypothetical protein
MRYKVIAIKFVEILAKVRREEAHVPLGRQTTRSAESYEWIYLSAGESLAVFFHHRAGCAGGGGVLSDGGIFGKAGSVSKTAARRDVAGGARGFDVATGRSIKPPKCSGGRCPSKIQIVSSPTTTSVSSCSNGARWARRWTKSKRRRNSSPA